MAQLEFRDIFFEEKGNKVRINFLRLFYFEAEKTALEEIGKFKINRNKIEFPAIAEGKAYRRFNLFLLKNFENLKNKLNNTKTIYIHKNCGIPLIGTAYFGLIDRGKNLIEIRPITSCNLNCIFCSVDEGKSSRKKVDFVVEKDYLVEEFKKLVDFKQESCIDAHINAQGEPLLYADIVELVADIAKIPQVKSVSIDTNGILLNKKLVDDLAKAGLTRINLSLHALDEGIANKLAGSAYNLKKVLQIAAYIPEKMDLIITPVWVLGYNDEKLIKLAKFAHKVGAGKNCPAIGIQSFLNYKFGRNPVKQVDLDVFYKKMYDLEKKHSIKLVCDVNDFKIKKSKELPKPFKKREIITVKIICPGRLNNEMLAVAKDRVISIPNCDQQKGHVNVKIRKIKHNLFLGELLN